LGAGDHPGRRRHASPREVDPKRIALVGVSQGGYWARRSGLRERIAAGVADPGVWDVSAPWLGHLPAFVRGALDAKDKVSLTRSCKWRRIECEEPDDAAFSHAPFWMTLLRRLSRVQEYNLTEVAARIVVHADYRSGNRAFLSRQAQISTMR